VREALRGGEGRAEDGPASLERAEAEGLIG
jgi:hypothetical protein